MNDPIFGQRLALMKDRFPEVPVSETPAGHSLQEEVPGEIAATVVRIADQAQKENPA